MIFREAWVHEHPANDLGMRVEKQSFDRVPILPSRKALAFTERENASFAVVGDARFVVFLRSERVFGHEHGTLSEQPLERHEPSPDRFFPKGLHARRAAGLVHGENDRKKSFAGAGVERLRELRKVVECVGQERRIVRKEHVFGVRLAKIGVAER
jgi:hypothetical protein